MVKVKIVNNSAWPLPKYQTAGAAAVDLHANIEKSVILKPGERQLISSGIQLALPSGYEAQIRPRSGLAAKHGVSIVNAPGTIDSDYRGDIGVILINLGQEDFEVKPGDRIAQMILNKYERFEWEETKELDDTDRGAGGFGSTGKPVEKA